MPINVEDFPDPPHDIDVTVLRDAGSVTLTPRPPNGAPARFKGAMERDLVGSFSNIFGWAVFAMKTFGGLFMILWLGIILMSDARIQMKAIMGVFGLFFAATWFGILTFIGRTASLPNKILALASPAWQLKLSRDLWQVSKRLEDGLQEKAYDATSLSNIRFANDYVIADEFDYGTGQWIQVQIAGPTDSKTGQWIASQVS